MSVVSSLKHVAPGHAHAEPVLFADYGGATLGPSQAVLSSPARTFAQSLQANKAEVDKVFQD